MKMSFHERIVRFDKRICKLITNFHIMQRTIRRLCKKIYERTQKGREKVLSTIETQVEFNSKVILSY